MATTGKVEISEEVQKEVEATYLHSIFSIIENNKGDKSRSNSIKIYPRLQ